MSRYRPPVVSNKSFGGVSKVKLSPDKTKVKVFMTRFRKDEQGNSVEYIDDYQMLAKNCPRHILDINESEKYQVKLSSDASPTMRKMTSLYPADGDFTFVFDSIMSEEGQSPAPRTTTPPWGGELVQFNAIVKFADGVFKGEKVVVWGIHFNFAPANHPDLGYILGYTKSLEGQYKSKHTIFLDNFLFAIGYYDAGPRQYLDNPLPEIDAVGKQKQHKWVGKLNKGKLVEIEPPSQLDVIEVSNDDWGGFEETASPAPEFSESDGEPPWPVEAETSDEKEIDLESDDAWAE